jgi:GrpB-like predicted nucleotidyltransferase (UPF0157 family)
VNVPEERAGAEEPVEIVPYDPSWPDRFERERALLEEALGPWIEGGLHHVGSTAVPGLAAKPIVDVMVGVRSLDEARPCLELAAGLGYRYFPYRPETMHWFCKPSPSRRTHHLALIEASHPEFTARLAFRDFLRANPDVAAEYEALKRRLAVEHRHDREAYTGAKAAFVRAVVERALAGRP